MVETRGLGVGQSSARAVDYAYDLFARLASETDSSRGATRYTYDKAGNRLTREFIPNRVTSQNPRILTRYAYGDDNRLMTLTEELYDAASLVRTRATSFTYNASGNLIEKVTPDKTIHYKYDSENRLILWTDEKDTVEFFYDGDGNRVAKRVNGGGLTFFVVDANREISQVLAELDGAGQVKQTYTYGLDRLSMGGPNEAYYLQDGLGSSAGLTDANGAMTENYSYDAFGNPLFSQTPSKPNTFLYTGERFDAETGLIYLRARYYDASIGRFISKDPILGKTIETQSFNAYPYVQNNPVNLTDPLGLAHTEKGRLKGKDYVINNPFLDFFNLEVSHEHIFFDKPQFVNPSSAVHPIIP